VSETGAAVARIAGTDRDWEVWGRNNPYFGVLSDSRFLNSNLDDDSLQEFFASGERHVDHVYEVIRARVQPAFQPARVLDYGCGVGRLVIPFAHRSKVMVGVDVSPSMLVLARENCEKFDAASATLLHLDELNTLAPASFDLVHSFIVFQHVPVARGEVLLRRLIELIAEGGVGAIHFLYSDSASVLRRGLKAFIQRTPFASRLRNLVRGLPYSSPKVEMNSYSMNRIFEILHNANCCNSHVELLTHGKYLGAMVYFEKSSRTDL
jgi:SAM-dependent methyltransferase